MKKLLISLVITISLAATPYRIRVINTNLIGQHKRFFCTSVAKDILASIKPHQEPVFKKYLEYERKIHALRDSQQKELNDLLKEKLYLEQELQNNPELNEPYTRFSSAVHTYFNNLAQTMLTPTKKAYRYSNDPTDVADSQKEVVHRIAQQIDMDMETFKDTCVKECLDGLIKQITNN